MSKKSLWIGLVVSIIAIVLIAAIGLPPLSAQQHRQPRGGGNVSGAGRWSVLTYVGDEGPFALKSDPLPGGGISFDFLNTPDRSMLITDSPSYKRLLLGDMTGKILVVCVEIEATPGATFNFYDTGGTFPPNVRLYFQKDNAKDCPISSEFHPERPDCEAQYWWSNPASISLADLAALGSAGYTFYVPLQPNFWSDRDGHMGTATSPINHATYFYQAVSNISKIGVSFGGGNNFAFGCGVNPGFVAKFKLLEFAAK